MKDKDKDKDKAAGDGRIPAGRPPPGELRPKLKPVTFKADAETLAALAALEGALGPSVRAKRSVAIRRAVLESAAALPAARPTAQAVGGRPQQ